jgi:hypothetical protein
MTSNNPLDWEYHQVDHLFLLIGENPLPNYVAAKTLLGEGGKPYLVYTEYTSEAYKRLKEVLCTTDEEKIEFEKQKVELWNNESNAFEIQEALKKKVKELQKEYPNKKRFGLNYTGGTKAMAVHAYQALLNLNLSPEPVFSYLDSRSLHMMFDRNAASPQTLDVFDVKPKHWLEMSFEKLFELHDLRWKQNDEPIQQPCLTQLAAQFLDLYITQRPQIAKPYCQWCEGELARKTKIRAHGDRYTYWLDENTLEGVTLDLSSVPIQIKQVLQNLFHLNSSQLPIKIAKNYGFKKISHFCEWLNAGWLEHYVLGQIQQINNLGIDESGMSFHIEDPNNPNAQWDKFEFDVAFRRSYQLFALSCTTAIYDNTCKEKLFEAYIRARQLGGAEAKVALVCPHNDPARLEKQLKILTQDRKIAVFGQKHLKKLSDTIAKWIEGKPY